MIITGCGGSGTGYMAAVLRACDVPCGHEQVFTKYGPIESNLRIDASWLAVPWLADSNATVIHILRDPLAVARSMVQFFDCEGEIGDHHIEWRDQRDVIRSFAPQVFDSDDLCERFASYYEIWNAVVDQHEHGRIMIEAVTAHDIQRIAYLAGYVVSAMQAQRALSEVPGNYNSHSYRDPMIESIPRLRELRQKYGYS